MPGTGRVRWGLRRDRLALGDDVGELADGRVAAMAEPLACVCHSLLEQSELREGDEVLVTGPGTIGLLAAQVVRAAGGTVHVRGTPRDRAGLDAAAGSASRPARRRTARSTPTWSSSAPATRPGWRSR